MQGIEEPSKPSYFESLSIIQLEESAKFLQEIRFEKGDQIDISINLHFGNSRNGMDRVRSIRNEYVDLRLGSTAMDGARAEAAMHNVEANNVIVIEDDGNFISMPSSSRTSAHNDVVFTISDLFPQQGRKRISRRRGPMQAQATNELDLELRVGIGQIGAGFSRVAGIGEPLTHPGHQQAPSNSTVKIFDDGEEDLCQLCKRRKLEPTSGQSVNMIAHVQANRLSITCPICLDPVKEECSTICGHIFCRVCIVSAIQTTKKCPTCRKKLTTNGFHRIFLPSSSE